MPLRLDMDLGDERAGGVEIVELAALGFGRHRFGHAMGREDHAGAVGRLVQLVDEDRAQLLQPLDDEAVVDDLVAHIDRRAIFLERQLDDADGPLDARAEAARGCQEQLQIVAFSLSRVPSALPMDNPLGYSPAPLPAPPTSRPRHPKCQAEEGHGRARNCPEIALCGRG